MTVVIYFNYKKLNYQYISMTFMTLDDILLNTKTKIKQKF